MIGTLTFMESRSSYTFPYSRYPAVRICLFLILGILLFRYYPVSISLSASLFFLFLALAGWLHLNVLQPPRLVRYSLSSLTYLICILAFGYNAMSLRQQHPLPPLCALLQVSPWEEVRVSGHILEVQTTASGRLRWTFRVTSTQLNSIQDLSKYKVQVLAEASPHNSLVSPGDQLNLSATLLPEPVVRNPHDFDYAAFLRGRGIQARVKLITIHSRSADPHIWGWVKWRAGILKLLDHNFTGPAKAIAKALIVGHKQDLDERSRTAFARAGLSHIMAVSGLHVGFIVAPFWVLIPYLWKLKYGSGLGLCCLLVLLFFYAGITGFSSSVLRASAMALFLSFAKLFHKMHHSINLTAAAACLLLIFDAGQLFELGFQLSFSAVLIILTLLPVIQRPLPMWVRFRWYGKPVMIIMITFIVQAGLYPLQAYYFREVSIIGPLANALFVPFLGLFLPLAIIATLASLLNGTIGYWLSSPADRYLNLMHDFVHFISGWDGAWSPTPDISWEIFPFWLLLILWLSSIHIPKLRWKLFLMILLLSNLFAAQKLYHRILPAPLSVIYFDVGQGDAALLKTPSGRSILIDTGRWTPNYNSGRSVILPHLKAEGITELDAVILSHPHADHIGGILEIIESIPVSAIYNSGYGYDSNLYRSYIHKAESKNIPIYSLQSGDTLDLDPSILLLILGPKPYNISTDPNEHSVILSLHYGNTRFLFTGDAGIHQERELINTYDLLLRTDVLKIGHHGSRTSSSSDFLEKTSPAVAVTSLGLPNKYGHPHTETLQRLYRAQIMTLYTAQNGAIMMRSNGEKVSQLLWKGS